MPRVAKPPKVKGQLVRLTQRDYRLLRDAVVMAAHERGVMMAEDWHEFDEMMGERWEALDKIKDAVYPRRRRETTDT